MNTVKILCGCGDLYEYPVHDGIVDVSKDGSTMCANCAMTFTEEASELPIRDCFSCKHELLPFGTGPCASCSAERAFVNWEPQT